MNLSAITAETIHYSAIVIGAGQAGLAMSHCLQRQGIDHLVLEKADKVGSTWRTQRWDSFCLVTPNWQCQLPGFNYQGADVDGFMVKDEIVQYLESYAASFNPPVIFNCPVLAVTRQGDAFSVQTARQIYTADQVVIACGSYHEPKIPAIARAMPAHIQHVHSSQYRNAAQLPAGDIMVVGTGQSGSQIAEDLHLAGRQVHLCVSSAPRVNRRYRGKDVVNWLDEMGYYRTTLQDHPEGKDAVHATNHYVTGRDGGRDINLRLFARQGMKLYGRLKEADTQHIHFADDLQKNLDNADDVAKRITDTIESYILKTGIDAPADTNIHSNYLPPTSAALDLGQTPIAAIVWATGFHMKFEWIQLPVLNPQGYPRQKRGVTDIDGLYFLGLNWMHTWGSGRFYHVGRDAEYLASILADRCAKVSSKRASFA